MKLALLHKYGIITTLAFRKYASPIFAQKKLNGKLRLLVDLRRIKRLIADNYINNNHPVSTLKDAAQHMAGKICSANSIAPRHITVFKRPTSNQSNSLHSTLQAEYLHTEDWRKELAVPYRHFRASYVNTLTQSSKLIIVHNTSTILALPPIPLNNYSKTYEQFSSVCGKLASNSA